ncbi:MAG: hypothetical protein PHV68_08535 [Candidatus Gastranaerophilales bacterium]|nr:hypothetical protein [Candidatus Gastranaerophilales bacterium]
MSFVTLSLFRNTNTLNRLNANSSMMVANQAQMNLLGNSAAFSPKQLVRDEQQVTFTRLNAQLKALFAEKNQEKIDKQLDENIKRSFSTFA